jgi:hypothetical protein
LQLEKNIFFYYSSLNKLIMLINFPNQLTSEEEQLLKKIAKMKKKVNLEKKNFKKKINIIIFLI